MQITNKLGLPAPIVAAVAGQEGGYDRGDSKFSVTDLVDPPQITYLKRMHADDLSEDASQRIWMLLGNAIHEILKGNLKENEIGETRLYSQIGGTNISGKFDHLALKDGVLTDYKVTSAYGVMHGVKPEWEKQLNYYRDLALINYSHPVHTLQIVAILRDWNKMNMMRSEDYPRQSVVKIDVPLWDEVRLSNELKKDVLEHNEAMDGNPRPCTDLERWVNPGKVALMKKARKSAIKLFDTQGELLTHCKIEDPIELKGGQYIEERPTTYRRCDDYCACAEFCPQLKEEANET